MKKYIFYLILIYCPLSNLLHHFYPISILGFSFWNTFLVVLLIHILLFVSNIKRNDYLIIFLFCFLYSIISLIRTYVIDVDFSNSFSNFWYLYLVLIFLIVVRDFQPSRVVFSNILLGHILFMGIIGTLFLFGLPTIEVQSAFTQQFFSETFHRYEGILGASNGHSNYLASFFLIFTLISKNKPVLTLLLSSIVFISILATGSRLPMIIFLLTLFFFIYNKAKFIIIPVLLCLYALVQKYSLLDLDYRILNNGLVDKSRADKTMLFFDLISSYFLEILTFGIHPSLLVYNNISISDNSFTLIILNSGIFIFLVWIFCIKIVYPNFFINLYRKRVFFVAVLLIFSLNNAILWLPWVLFVLFFVRFYQSINHMSYEQ